MFSNPLDGDTQARITNLIQEIVAGFTTNFPVCYAVALVEDIKAEKMAAKGDFDDCQLEEAPVPSFDLKSGFLTKRGDAHKNWKRRHCVAHNAADNFRVDYFDGEGGKLKGSIHCAGYHVENFNADDEIQFGQFGLKLVPWMKIRRTWYIRCDNEEDRRSWTKALETACWKAHAPSDPNPIIARAFNKAFERVRWNYGYWGYYSSYGAEDERLGDFIRQVLAREIVDAVIGGIPAGFFYSSMVSMVETTIATSVRAAVSAAWSGVVSGVNTVAATLKTTAESNLGPIFEQQQKIKEKIVTTVSATTAPFMTKVGSEIFSPVFSNITGPVARAFAEALKTVHAGLKAKIAEGSVASSLDDFDRSGDWWSSGPLEIPKKIISEMWESAPDAIFHAAGFSLWNVRWTIIEQLEALFHRATYTLGKLIKENAAVTAAQHAAEVMRRYVHDAKIFLFALLMNVIRKLLASPVSELVIKPCKALVAPIQDMIDAIPIPGLSTLFDLEALLGDAVKEICDNGIKASLDGYLSTVYAAVDGTTTQVTAF